MKKIRIAYEIISPESAEQGDVEERGWIDEEGEFMDPSILDAESTAVDLAITYIEDNIGADGIEPSSSDFHKGVWYTTYKRKEEYDTGRYIHWSFFLDNFTEEEEKEIFERITGRKE